MELSDYIRILRKNWLIIVVVTLVGIGLAAAFSLTRTPMFTSSATVAVSTQAGGSGTAAELQQGSNFAQARMNTYVGLVGQNIVLGPVIENLGIETTPAELASSISAAATLNSTLLTITATNADPDLAAALANETATSLAAAVPEIEAGGADAESPLRMTTVTPATAATEPSSPNVPFNLALGALLGLALGLGIAVLRSVLDTQVRTPRDVAHVTDAPLIGAISNDPKAKERPLIVHVDPLSPRAESFRALRTNLQFLDMDGRSSFVVTSSLPAEGKSSTTVNLAIALADAGKKVALLDADLRKPKVAEYLGLEGGVGLTDVLIGRVRVGDVMLPWGGRSLFVLPAGKIPPNPSELLGSQQMKTLLEVLERDFDVVLCDAPPLLPVTDAAILAKSTSGAIIAVASGKPNRHQLSAAVDTLETVGAKVAGVVMTMMPMRGPDAYYGQYGGTAYGYRVEQGKNTRTGKPEHEIAAFTPVTPLAPQATPAADSAPRRTTAQVVSTPTSAAGATPPARVAAAPSAPAPTRAAAAPATQAKRPDFDALLTGQQAQEIDPIDVTTRRRP